METPNLRTYKIDTSDGKDVRDTKWLSGEATRDSNEKAKNVTTEYVAANPGGKDHLGGENTNS